MSIDRPILVTGATGFVGGHLVDRLVAGGLRPRVLVRGDTNRVRVRWGDAVEIAPGDIADGLAVARAVAGVRTVFHLAAEVGDAGTLATYRAATVLGTRNLMEAAAREKPLVVLTSSIAVYGTRLRTHVLDEDLPWGPPAGYYSSCKQEQERLAADMASRGGVPLVVVRPSNVYGPRSRIWVDTVVAELRRGTPLLIGGGDFNAGLCQISNLVDVLVLVSSRPEAVGRVYNACDGSAVTWKTYFGDLARIAGTSPPRSVPRAVATTIAAVGEPLWRVLRLPGRAPLTHEALNIVGSDSRIPNARVKRELGFEPAMSYEASLAGIETYLHASPG